jgi:uroporphyrin-III C-methyltransferase
MNTPFPGLKPAGPAGIVHLVGAGPGDPELITLRARRLLGEADAVIYDHLVGSEILDFARRDSERIFVGKEAGRGGCRQEDIDALLVRLGREGKTVVRLKGGDPGIFGRGGEEAAALMSAGIPFTIVPGVTAALAAAAYSGIPLTHRAHSSAVVFLTGHEDPGKATSTVRWEDYATLKATLCIYMGMRNLANIASRLQAGGMSADMPAALVQAATTEHHRLLIATLGTLAGRAASENFSAPGLIVIGEVATFAGKLAWFEPVQAAAASHS